MPSFWKKQTGNRITRLVADLQTPSKRGGSLVVETGFPTSLIDLFVKHRDKLKKPKTKKHKSKKLTTISEDNDCGFQKPFVSHLPNVSFCELDGPRCSIVGNFEQKVDNFEENVVNNDLSVENVIAHETSVVELNHDCSKSEENDDEHREEIVEVSNSKNLVILLSILMVALFFGVELYARNWFFALIIMGVLLLSLLEYLGNLGYGLFKNHGNSVWMLILKGALIVVIALNTKWFLVGITIGACLLILLEYGKGKFHDLLPNLSNFNKEKWDFNGGRRRFGGRGLLIRAILFGSKKELPSDGKCDKGFQRDFDEGQFGNGAIPSREIVPECGNGIVSKRGVEDGRNVIVLKGEREQRSRDSSLCNEISSIVEEEKQLKPVYERLALESKDLNDPKSSDSSDFAGCIDLQGEKGVSGRREQRSKDFKLVNHDGKSKKDKKFWKKLIPKKKSRKAKKHEHEVEISVLHSDNIQDNATDLEEVDEQKEDEEVINEEGLSTSISRSRSTLSLDEEDDTEIDKFESENFCITKMLQFDNRNSNSCEKMKYLTAMMIPLAGLIGGRMLAVVVTVICCLMFKMSRR